MGIMKTRLALLLIGLTACGCALAPTKTSRELYVQNNPGLATDIKDTISTGRLITGMTKQDVTASIGRPNAVQTTTSTTGTTEVWTYGVCTYGCTMIYFNGDGKAWDILTQDNR